MMQQGEGFSAGPKRQLLHPADILKHRADEGIVSRVGRCGLARSHNFRHDGAPEAHSRYRPMESPPPDGPSREHRPRVLKGATIITGFQNSEISCSLRNQHSQGAELRLAADIQ
ncbi:MAG: hypothetical protein EOQ53_31545, partial [Mesorhizobium sp.]